MSFHLSMRYLVGIFIFCVGLSSFSLFGQYATIEGYILDEDNAPVVLANVAVKEFPGIGSQTNLTGFFSFQVPTTVSNITIQVTSIQYQEYEQSFSVEENTIKKLDIQLKTKTVLIDQTTIHGSRVDDLPSTFSVEVKEGTLPNPSGSIEAYLAIQVPSVSKNNELSSAYSVRGGNFDENLVYVNDFEVYRPFLIRSGQQEGLSFVNPDMVKSLVFSAGGFQAKYGDKMSSVLDVTYNKPTKFTGSVSGSLLGGSVFVGGLNKNKRFTYSIGVRNWSSRYLLGSQDVKGQYAPSFVDVQSYLTYQINESTSLEYIVNYARNRFDFIPEDRETDFGLINFQARFRVFYEGEENDQYDSFMNGIALINKPTKKLELKWMSSFYTIAERERFDIIGEYWLGEVETDPANENAGGVRFQLGSGIFHDWARNELYTTIYSAAHKGKWFNDKHTIRWGLTYKHEIIDDKISEWERIDSSGYSLPYSGDSVLLYDVLKAEPFRLTSNRYSGYFQDTWRFGDSSNVTFNYGLRVQYWDINQEWLFSPRMQFSVQPKSIRSLTFTMASGMYMQPPFYREMRNLNGELNFDLNAQKSAHAVFGIKYDFMAWNRPFKFVTELYYKYLWDIVPYEFDNVLIRYFGKNNAKGYTTGIEFLLNGELAKDAESWVSMAIMKSEEDILDDVFVQYIIEKTKEEQNGAIIAETKDTLSVNQVNPGNIPRPTDQRISFGLFFQDYIPKVPYIKVHMNLVFATGLPFGPPDSDRYKDQFRIPAYRRFDIGFSALLFDQNRLKEKEKVAKGFFKHIDRVWLTAEVFNLFGVQNTVSYVWIRGLDVRTGRLAQYAVPNYLTNRRFNVRLKVDF